MTSTLHERGQIMTSASAARRELRAAARLCLPLALLGSTFITTSVAQQPSANPMQLTLEQAINLALKQNHSIHLRSLSVEQMQSRKDEARSNYLPQLKASGSVLHVTELEGVEIPAGAFGSYQSTGPVPAKSLVIDQGSLTGYIGGDWAGAASYSVISYPPGERCGKTGSAHRQDTTRSNPGCYCTAGPPALLQHIDQPTKAEGIPGPVGRSPDQG